MKKVVDKLSCKYDDRTEDEKSLKRIFWLPENTPEFKEAVKKVELSMLCDVALQSDHVSQRRP